MNDSNCAASTRYINTNDSRKAYRNALYARCNSFDCPCMPEEYSAGRFRSFTKPCNFARASDSEEFGGRLDEIVTTRWRFRRAIDDGLRASWMVTTRDRSTGFPLDDETVKYCRF